MAVTKYKFDNAALVDLRRFCGYPVRGTERNTAISLFGTLYFQQWELFEYRVLNLSPAEGDMVEGYLTTLRGLEQGIINAAASLGIESAAVFTRNPKELRERVGLYENFRHRLCAALGVSGGPYLGSSGGTRNVPVTL